MTAPDFEAEARDVIDRVVDTHGGFGLMSAIASALRRIDAAGYARAIRDARQIVKVHCTEMSELASILRELRALPAMSGTEGGGK